MALSMFSLEGKVAIVTGAGRGVGKGIALGYAQAGANIIIAELDVPAGETVAREIRALGREALVVATDVTKNDQVENMVARTMAKFGKIDILCNNVGGNKGLRILVTNMEEDVWDSIVDLNLKSTFLCNRAVARVMIEQKQGNIINIASTGALRPGPGNTPYTAAKAGVIQFTQSLAVELAVYHIRVNCIIVGTMEVPGVQKQGRVQNIPLGRLGRPEDIAPAAIYLASSASEYVTGETIAVRGGPMARPGDLQMASAPAPETKSK